ncbi:nucleolar protein 11 [Pararge aegeria]|uniref:Jg17793 protein n=1 Tax=Pararge aegeria aegeria TaxID=348720 RepID=A0A8S4RIL7_9NEOP|nr:nucleolar protein 11 [Pararge aegeria]CAH2237096.1 jg17793 [Pararge aegeria aegeria]
MAKLHNYYVLCPLIDQNSFLGVARDRDDENVIVTLGRNVVNKYRLSDQKQIGGWTSKDHLTSAVIFDKEQDAYVGVFNRNTIKTWKDDSCSLDKSKKFKFSVNIMKLIPREDEPSVIVFENGNCASLPYALDNRKTYENKLLVKDSETIVEIACYKVQKTDYICYVIKRNKNLYEIITCPIREELGDMEISKINRVKVVRADSKEAHIVGKFISADENPAIYFMWSDTTITEYDLIKKTWKTIGTVPWISTITSVSIAWMGKDHLILFGSNTDQDGAIIVAYNIILGVGSCRYPMKMYSENAKLYCFNGRIILEASNHIGMLPYVLEINRNLSSLLGSHEIKQNNHTEIANWDTPVDPLFNYPKEVKSLLKLGLTERSMCAQVIGKLVEEDDINNINQVIRKFVDVPESVLVILLNYAIKNINPASIDITNHEEFVKFCKNDSKSFTLLQYLFEIVFSDAMLIPYLRNGLSLDSALFLLNYISYLLVDSDIKIDSHYESKLFDWCTLLMDSFYQQYLLTKDEKVSDVLNNVQNVVGNLIDQLTVIDSTLPMLHKIVSGTYSDPNDRETLPYTIEMINI